MRRHALLLSRYGCGSTTVASRCLQIRSLAQDASPRRATWPRAALLFLLGIPAGIGLNIAIYWNESVESASSSLSPTNFLPFTLVSKDRISPTSSIFNLTPASDHAATFDYQSLWRRAIWSVEIKQPQLQIARHYTPLPPALNPAGQPVTEDQGMHILIREEPKGEVSGYLHRLPVGAKVELRGPHIEYKLPRNMDEVVFIAGGTGIAPALQAVEALLEGKEEQDGKPRMHILWANRRREDCEGGVSDTPPPSRSWLSSLFGSGRPAPTILRTELGQSPLVDELQRLKAKHEGHLKVDYFVDDEGSVIDAKALAVLRDESAGKRLVLVSGPEGFVRYLAGDKAWQNGTQVQGQVGGLLVGLKDTTVWKL